MVLAGCSNLSILKMSNNWLATSEDCGCHGRYDVLSAVHSPIWCTAAKLVHVQVGLRARQDHKDCVIRADNHQQNDRKSDVIWNESNQNHLYDKLHYSQYTTSADLYRTEPNSLFQHG